MEITTILNSDKKTIVKNIDVLAEVYLKETGRKVCKTCPSSVNFMILTLKHKYKMLNFRFKKERAQYKIRRSDRFTISNDTLTNERAIEFIKERPERIELFSEYPSNWKELIEGKEETEKEAEARIAIEAEQAAIKEGVTIEQLEAKTLKELREMYPSVKAKSKDDFILKVLEL